MKVSVRRHGIIIKTFEVSGDRATIGSGADCAIHIEDPYLGAHVADFVNAGGTWKIVDTGMALEGITLEGRRVEDEPLSPGVAYSVGGFEIVAEGFAAAAGAAPPPPPVSHTAPTMAGDAPTPGGEDEMPKTMMAPMPASPPKAPAGTYPKTEFATPVPQQVQEPKLKPSPAAGLAFKPLTSGGATPTPGVPMQAAPAGGGKSSRKLMMIVAAMGLLLVVLAIVLVGTGGGEKAPAEQVTATETTATVAPEAPAKVEMTADDYVAEGDEHAKNLEIEQAIVSWEAAIDHGAGPEIKQRVVRTALEVGLVYHAARDKATAKKYFEAVVRWGEPGSAEVKLAQSRL